MGRGIVLMAFAQKAKDGDRAAQQYFEQNNVNWRDL